MWQSESHQKGTSLDPPAIYWTRPVTCICLCSALENSLGPLARESPCIFIVLLCPFYDISVSISLHTGKLLSFENFIFLFVSLFSRFLFPYFYHNKMFSLLFEHIKGKPCSKYSLAFWLHGESLFWLMNDMQCTYKKWCIYIYIYIYTHTHTHTHTYIYIYICGICVAVA
jgi:hypothetical protein